LGHRAIRLDGLLGDLEEVSLSLLGQFIDLIFGLLLSHVLLIFYSSVRNAMLIQFKPMASRAD
jgi:hypothetical protein